MWNATFALVNLYRFLEREPKVRITQKKKSLIVTISSKVVEYIYKCCVKTNKLLHYAK